MSIYDYDITNATANLLAPNKRLSSNFALMSIPGWILQKIQDRIFNKYAGGDSSPDWVSGDNYGYESTVCYDKSIYECINPLGIIALTIEPKIDTTNWLKVQDNFIGLRERMKYTSSKIFIEYALNRYFKVQNPTTPFTGASQTNQIYLLNYPFSLNYFWLSNGSVGAHTSYLANNSQNYCLGNAYTWHPFAFAIYVPVAVWVTLGSTDAIREGAIRAVADKQVQCGKSYNVLTY